MWIENEPVRVAFGAALAGFFMGEMISYLIARKYPFGISEMRWRKRKKCDEAK